MTGLEVDRSLFFGAFLFGVFISGFFPGWHLLR